LQVKQPAIAEQNLAKIRNLDEILDEIGDSGRMKNVILDSIFLGCLPIPKSVLQIPKNTEY